MSLRFTKAQRVVSSDDFTRAIRKGGCAADGTLVVFAIPTPSKPDGSTAPSRLGVTIPKRTGNAVCRNHWKRLVRQAFRIHQHSMPVGFDVVVRPKKDATLSWRAVEKSMKKLPQKAVQRIRS